MKTNYLSLCLAILICNAAFALPKYWVGPANGDWNNSTNWSLTNGGAGSAGVPTSSDSVIFLNSALVNVNTSPMISALTIGNLPALANVTLYAMAPTTLTVLNNLGVAGGSVLKDSTGSAVSFNLILNGGSAAKASIQGRWEFEGGVPLAGSDGAFFTAQPGSVVTVGNGTNLFSSTISFRSNSGTAISSPSSLTFTRSSNFLIIDNSNPMIPAASWAGIDANPGGPANPDLAASIITIQGNCGSLRHLQAGSTYGTIIVNLPTQQNDVSLNFPNGTVIQGNLNIANTNGKTITLLSKASPTNTVSIRYSGLTDGGDLLIAGANSRVALSTVLPGDPAVDFKLIVTGSFTKSGGNFSLQDGDNAAGSATLSIKYNLTETGGTFITSSAATKKLAVEMSGPIYLNRPGGIRNLGQTVSLASGTIDNAQHNITFRVDQAFILYADTKQEKDLGVVLSTPLTVGKLELIRGTIKSASSALLTVGNSTPQAISQGTDSSYIIGPFQIATSSPSSYLVPTGSEPTYSGGFYGLSNTKFHKDSMVLMPSSASPSVFRAEYFSTPYTDIANVTAPLQAVANNKYWDITKVSGGDASVRLTLDDSIPNSSFMKALVVAHYEDGKWVAVNGSVLTPGNAKSGFVTSKVLSSFSPFTFGIVDPSVALAIHFKGFTARKTNEGATLDWSVETAPVRFEVMRSGNGTEYTAIGNLTASSAKNAYQFIDKNILPGTNYYRIKSVEADGNTGLSIVSAVLNAGDGVAITTLAPNRVDQYTKLLLNTAKAGKASVIITDMAGRSWKRLIIDVSGGNSEKVLNLGDLPAGLYQISVMMNDLITPPLRFVKK